MSFELPVLENRPQKRKPPKPKKAIELADGDYELISAPGEFQEKDLVKAFEIHGFDKLNVVATLESKDERKNNPDKRNQDNILADPETGLMGVMDGLGGEQAGDLASKSAERFIPENYKQSLKEVSVLGDTTILKRIVEQQISNFRMARTSRPSARAVVEKETKQMVEEAIKCDPEIAQKALALLQAMRDTNEYVQETNGMTTACVGLVHEAKDGSRWAIIANVGDSAALKRNKDGDMIQLTQEDSFIEYVKTVSKKKVMNNKGEVVPLLEAMKKTPRKKFDVFPTFGKINYLQLKATVKICLGSREFEPSITIQRVNPGDEIIFATDGVIDKYDDIKTDETDLAALGKDTAPGATLVERINNLRRAAKKRSVIYKNDDDVAIVAARILER